MQKYLFLQGAASGMIISHITVLWITINGLMIDKPKIPMLPTTIDGCNDDTFSPHIRPLVKETSYYLNLSQSTTPNPIVHQAAPER